MYLDIHIYSYQVLSNLELLSTSLSSISQLVLFESPTRVSLTMTHLSLQTSILIIKPFGQKYMQSHLYKRIKMQWINGRIRITPRIVTMQLKHNILTSSLIRIYFIPGIFLHCWLVPVQNRVDVRLVTQISSPSLNVSEVWHHIHEAK